MGSDYKRCGCFCEQCIDFGLLVSVMTFLSLICFVNIFRGNLDRWARKICKRSLLNSMENNVRTLKLVKSKRLCKSGKLCT